jgi:predicted Na+-dependent transporter
MRDFAVAAALATAAFGPQAAAPLGLYGIAVLVWGTAAAGWLRRRPLGPPVTWAGLTGPG